MLVRCELISAFAFVAKPSNFAQGIGILVTNLGT